jgi:serine/threonine-protein kinase RsbW
VSGAYPVLHLGPTGPARALARTFRGTPASVREARRFVAELLFGCPAMETLVTCVSELSSNAVSHTDSGRGGTFTVQVARREGVARIAVTDDGGASVPAAKQMDLPPAGTADLPPLDEDVLDQLAEGGRGLALVAACTSRWGFAEATPGAPGHHPGRTVWAEATWPVPVPAAGPVSPGELSPGWPGSGWPAGPAA